ncbi:M48 family metalloprotease [Pseudomonadales bacterium]|nr:M48 family metalloprotease [Pseudomonadales bacterium]
MSSFLLFSLPVLSNELDSRNVRAVADQHEQTLKTSNFRAEKRQLEALLQEMACKVPSIHCSQLRIYVMRSSEQKILGMPNGAVFLTTGLLLRMRSDSEIAGLIFHEIAHIQRGHFVSNFQTRKRNQNLFNLVTLPLRSIATWRYVFNEEISLYERPYSNRQEKEADIDAIESMTKAGYSSLSLLNVLQRHSDEADTPEKQRHSLVTAHPVSSGRLEHLRVLTESSNKSVNDDPENVILDLLNDYRVEFLYDELQEISSDSFIFLLFNQRKFSNLSSGTLNYLCASSWVFTSKANDLPSEEKEEAYINANACFKEGAQSEEGMPAIGYREWGKLNDKMGNKCRAKKAYQAYLKLDPSAWDAKFVVKRLGKLAC